jgi:hypothetical protein
MAGVPGQKAGDLVSQTLIVTLDDTGTDSKVVHLIIDQILK